MGRLGTLGLWDSGTNSRVALIRLHLKQLKRADLFFGGNGVITEPRGWAAKNSTAQSCPVASPPSGLSDPDPA